MEDTKQRILEKSLELFSTKGYDAVSVGEIAKAVGIKAPLRSRSMYRIPKRISRFSPTSQRSCWLKKSDRSSFIRCTIKPSASSAG